MRPRKYPREIRERAVRMVLEIGERGAIARVASQLDLNRETLRHWVRRAEVDQGLRDELTTEQMEELKQLRRENFELRRANEILKSASAFSHGNSTVPTRDDPLHRRAQASLRGRALWVADLTEIVTWSGVCYAGFVVDAYSRMFVGWSLATHIRTELPLEALEMAIWRRDTVLDGPVHHSDAGSQYTSIRYTERLAEAGIAPSVGSVGDSYDNALAETQIGLYKTELIERQRPWRTPEEVELATLEYVDWFNNRRLHGSIGDVPPAAAEGRYYSAQKTAEVVEIQ